MLPRQMGDPSDFHSVFLRLFGEYADNLPPYIVFDISQVTFIQPMGVVFLCNTVLWLRRQAVKCEIATGQNIGTVSAFLDDSGLFKELFGSALRPFASLRPATFGSNLFHMQKAIIG